MFILNVVDGCIPSEKSTGNADDIEEERRYRAGSVVHPPRRRWPQPPMRCQVRLQPHHKWQQGL